MIGRFPLTVLVVLGAGIWALVLAGHGWVIPTAFFTPLSLTVGALVCILLVFDRWAWRWPGVSLASSRPDLRGTWMGEVRSDWKDATGSTAAPIRASLVVHQTYTEVHLRMLTAESESVSLATSLRKTPDGRYVLTAVYLNQPKIEVRHRSPIHNGGLKLQVSGEGDRLLGEYWTDRGTCGSLDFGPVSRVQALDFQVAEKLAASNPPES